MPRLKILVIAPYLPFPPETGWKIRVYHLYSRLARQHDITWVCPITDIEHSDVAGASTFCKVIGLPVEEYITLPETGPRNLLRKVLAHLRSPRLFEYAFGYVRAPGQSWFVGTPERLNIVEQVNAATDPDVVIVEGTNAVELASPVTGIPRLIDLHNIHFELFRRIRRISQGTWEDRLFYPVELAKIKRYESRFYSTFDFAFTVSETDRTLLSHLCPKLESTVIHNGVDVEYFHSAVNQEIPMRLVFVGHYGYEPNREAAFYFCKSILPQIQAQVDRVTFVAVGRDAPMELARFAGVEVYSSVPDVRPYLEEAAVVVVPLRAGSGTRIKILEAMAMGKAVVSTTVGAEGLEVKNGSEIIIADTPDDFAKAVVTLLSDPARRESIGHRARKLVESQYSWEQQAIKLTEIVETFAGDKHGRTRDPNTHAA